MNFITRAWLYIIRKKGKSILLFIVLLLIATFVLTTLSIGKAMEVAQKNLRQSLGGEFLIAPDYSSDNPYFKVEQVEDGMIMYSTQQILPSLVEKIRNIDGVKYCDARFENIINTDLEYFSGNISLDEELVRSTKIIGVWKSEESGLFTSGKIKLIEGRHINPQDENKVIISKDLADKNGLKIGDTIKNDEDATLEIIGLFTTSEIEDFNDKIATYDKIQNLMISDLSSLVTMADSPMVQGFNELTVTVEDPLNIEKIISEVRKNDDVDWKGFTITMDTETYDNASTSLVQLSSLVSTILVVVVISSIAILSLILTMWARARIHETGIFLSVGIKKVSILGQYITEVLIIAVVAFSLSYFPSNLIANQVGELLQKKAISDLQKNEGEDLVGEKNGTNASIDNGKKEIEVIELDISVQTEQIFLLFLLGIGVVIISASISSISVMRLKPREILSKMS